MTAPNFSGFSNATIEFLRELKENNNRDWFSSNKNIYESAIKSPCRAFAGMMESEIERLTGIPHKARLFRINRDIRFSKDKTPYNTHVHISWTAMEGGGPAWMFGLSDEYCTLGCGTFEFNDDVLETFRRRIAETDGNRFSRIVGNLLRAGYRLQAPVLKRVPPGYATDLPTSEFLRHKGIVMWRDLEGPDAASNQDIAERCTEGFKAMLPLWRFLREQG